MQKFDIHILGCGAALPTPRRLSSSQIVNIREKLFMLDCAEGTQMALRRSHLTFSRLQAIFLTHLHGDHTFGLIGMLSTFGLLGRTQDLHIYGPQDLQRIFQPQIDYFCADSPYKIILHEIDTKTPQIIYEDRSVTISTLPLAHRIPCCGYLFREKPTPRHIRRDMIDFYHIPISQINNIKAGMDWKTEDGTLIPNGKLTTPSDPVRSYAYCTDTTYHPQLIEHIHGITCLYHEATFAQEHALLARKTFHCTAAQAAQIALDAHVSRLILGHFSSRYPTEDVLLQEAQTNFPATLLAEDGMKISL
ncbi:MAG: ribonuclease Z [Bacteroidaceae bacterium]|nr:ribonuclease Z [Bacteroidaceae bacterium]